MGGRCCLRIGRLLLTLVGDVGRVVAATASCCHHHRERSEDSPEDDFGAGEFDAAAQAREWWGDARRRLENGLARGAYRSSGRASAAGFARAMLWTSKYVDRVVAARTNDAARGRVDVPVSYPEPLTFTRTSAGRVAATCVPLGISLRRRGRQRNCEGMRMVRSDR